MNFYVAEETRQAEDLRQAEAYRLVTGAEKGRVARRRALSSILILVGEKLIEWACRLQDQVEGTPCQGLVQAR